MTFSRVKVEKSRVKACIPRSVGWSLVPRTFPRMSCSMVLFTGIVYSSILWCSREKREINRNPHAWAISHARSARPPGRPDERPDERVIMQPPAPASTLAELPPAASPQLGRWMCQQGLRFARMRCLLLWCFLPPECCCCCCCCCFDDDCSCFFTFGHISY